MKAAPRTSLLHTSTLLAVATAFLAAACTGTGGRRSSSNDASADGSDGSDGSDGTADVAGPPNDVIDIPDLEACSTSVPDGACEGSAVCTGGECVTPTVSVALLEVTGDQWSGTAASAYGGANNGLVEAGEEVTLRPTLQNGGTLNYLSVSGELTSKTSGVTVVTGAAVYDDLVAGGSKAPETGFRVLVGKEVPNGTVATLELAVIDSKEGNVITLPLRVGVRSGVALGMANPFVDDDSVGKSEGDSDRKVDPGEAIELVLDLENVGVVDVPVAPLPFDQVATTLGGQEVEVRMTSASPLITVLDLDNPPTFAATVPAGGAQSSAADFDFTVSAEASEGTDAACLDFTISLKAAGKALYAFSEVRCVTFGAELGPSCSPKPELCNNLDDDCDGKLDNSCTSTCGDGTTDPWEACDDKNTESGDGCSSDCLVSEGCGNGVVDPGEVCDTAIAGSCPDKPSCEAKTDCTSQWTHSGVACQQTCTSKPANGTTCDDKDACTTGDKCVSGKCAGTPKVCSDAPANSCTGSTAVTYTSQTGTCKAGVCEYQNTKKTCKTKCSQGFCSPDVQGASVAPVAGTFRSFALVETATAKGQLVYSGDDGIRMAEIGAEGPTGNDAPISYTQGAGSFGLGAGVVAGKVKVAWLEESILYVGTEASPDFLTSWQTSSADWNYRDLTAAWTADGLAHIFFRSANDSKLYYHVEDTTWSGTGVLSNVSDLGRAAAFGANVWAPTVSGGKIVLYGNGGTDTIPGSSGGGEPAMAVGADGARYVIYRLEGQLVLATDTTGAGGASWSGVALSNLDPDHTGFAIAVNGKGTKCIAYGNNSTNEMAFLLQKGTSAAAYLVDDQFQSITNQERVIDLVAGVDGRFYMTYLTADSDGLVNIVIRPDE